MDALNNGEILPIPSPKKGLVKGNFTLYNKC
jgi:hypothetical protein